MSQDFDDIPAELKDRDQWLLWDASHDTPRQPHWNGDFAISWSDPDEWHSFDEAVEMAAQEETWGIGYVTAADNPDYARGLYGVIDIDGAADDDQHAEDWVPSLEPFADRDAYMEWSPSGTGIHIPIVGMETPDWWSDVQLTDDEHTGVDVLTNKFCTFTADELRGTGEEIAEYGDYVEEWLIQAHKAVTGEDPTETKSADFDSASEGGRSNRDEYLEEDDIREALTYINPDVPYDTWRDIGFALADFFGDATALRLFSNWSSGGSKWDSDAERQAERIIRDADSGGGRTIGTVIHHAKQGGWEMPTRSGGSGERTSGEDGDGESGDGSADGGDGTPDDLPDPSHVETWEAVRQYYEQPEETMEDKYARQAATTKLLDEFHFACAMDNERLWVYDEETGTYDSDGAAVVEQRLGEKLKAHYSQHEMREIVGKLRAASYIQRDDFDGGEDDHLICVANGVLDLKERDLYEHSPDYYFTRNVPVEYDPDAEAPHVEDFLSDIVRRPVEKDVLLEMVGACLWPSYEHSKFLILFGEGANGKSTFFEMVEKLLGSDNVAGWEIQKLSENRFATSDLVDKFANIAPDMPGTKLQELGTLKKLTGGDVAMAERKREQAFEFVNSATLMFGANRPPVIPEASRAIKRRLVPIRLPYNFTHKDDNNPDARDRDALLEELTNDDELSGLLNLALDGLERLRDQGDVSLPESHEERLEYYEQFSDPIKEFRVTCLKNEEGTRTKKDTIYHAYKEFCRANDYSIKDKRVFWRTLRQTTLMIDESRPQIGETQKYVLESTRFSDEALSEYVPHSMMLGDPSEQMDVDTSRISELAPGDDGVAVEGRIEDVDTDTPDSISQTATIIDESDEARLVVWDDANKPKLQEGEHYRLKEVRVTEHEGQRNICVNSISGVVEISAGVGHAPMEDAGDNGRLDEAAADGGYEGVQGRIMQTMQQTDGKMSVAALAGELDEDPTRVKEGIDSLCSKGRLIDRGDGVELS